MKHRWRWKSTKGDSVWKHMTWRCARCGATATLTVAAEEAHEAKHRPGGGRTHGAPANCKDAIVEQVHKL